MRASYDPNVSAEELKRMIGESDRKKRSLNPESAEADRRQGAGAARSARGSIEVRGSGISTNPLDVTTPTNQAASSSNAAGRRPKKLEGTFEEANEGCGA